jgi:hypothetical protein
MIPNVHILVSCSDPGKSWKSNLVFQTLRTGFPTAKIIAHLNEGYKPMVGIEGAVEIRDVSTIHHKWIEGLINTQTNPFYILDTDVIFYENFEKFQFDTPLAGFKVPEFQDEFSNAISRSRLHTALMYIDPEKVKFKLAGFNPDETVFTPVCNFIYPQVLALNGRRYFHDTCSLLFHAVGGMEFSREQKDAYFHFNFGTIEDLVLPRLKDGAEMLAARKKVLNDLSLGKGLWKEQEKYYAKHPVDLSTKSNAQDLPTAVEFNKLICNGNQEAMEFADLWYRYCHGIDDLLDTRSDGRPTMNSEQILWLFALAATLYNHSFFKKWADTLYPIVLLVTNQYADSVAWENSPISHQRTMGDCLRICGDEMYNTLAMICGGWQNMRNYSLQIRDRDWINQHDKDGNPT